MRETMNPHRTPEFLVEYFGLELANKFIKQMGEKGLTFTSCEQYVPKPFKEKAIKKIFEVELPARYGNDWMNTYRIPEFLIKHLGLQSANEFAKQMGEKGLAFTSCEPYVPEPFKEKTIKKIFEVEWPANRNEDWIDALDLKECLLMDTLPLHEILTPEGYQGWQWMSGPIFLYEIEDETDSMEAKLRAIEWAEVEMKVMRLQFEVKIRADRIVENEPVISIEEMLLSLLARKCNKMGSN
jgi:predicted peroxiredoxin